MRVIFIFESLHKLIKADNLLKENNVKARVIPVPTSYHSTCGMCLECNAEAADIGERWMTIEGVKFEKYCLG